MNVQTGCTGYVHIAAMRKMENERSIIKQAKAEVKCRKEEILCLCLQSSTMGLWTK